MRFDKEKDNFKNILLKARSNEKNKHNEYIENIIIIGSSCVNPAAENIMDVIYSKTEEERPKFQTSHLYKSRSDYWNFSIKKENTKEENTKESGIYMKNQQVGSRERVACTTDGFFLRKDTAFLIICNGNFYYNNYERMYESKLEEESKIKGDIILLSGFGKYGTYELSRMLSKINKPSNIHDKHILIKDNNTIEIEDFFKMINDIKYAEKNNKFYCVEAIFDFIQHCSADVDDKEKCDKECPYRKKDDNPYCLKIFNAINVSNDGKKIEREDLIPKLLTAVKTKSQE